MSAVPRHMSRRSLLKRIEAVEKIKVVFICQYIPAWSKNKQLYEALISDDRFEVLLLCIPNRIQANRLIDPEDMSNDVYDYYFNKGYPESTNALIGEGEWFDLKCYGPEFVIYNRYDRPMPPPYISSVVSTYTKVCFIHYATDLLRVGGMLLDKPFLSNTYLYFAESTENQAEFMRWNAILCRMKLSKAVYCGIPAVENAFKAKNDRSVAWAFSRSNFRIIYAPRWTSDLLWGGSSFLTYNDVFFSYADTHQDVDILVRPHPLMFDHFIDTGEMTITEA